MMPGIYVSVYASTNTHTPILARPMNPPQRELELRPASGSRGSASWRSTGELMQGSDKLSPVPHA